MFEVVIQLLECPQKFNFSGISDNQMKANISNLNFDQLIERLNEFSRGDINYVELDGCTLIKSPSQLNAQSLDFVFSNSVLEHVQPFLPEMQDLRQRLKTEGICLHTVDFADHRFYMNKNLHLFEMYYDGVLHEINGLRSSLMESYFVEAGFSINNKLGLLGVPKTYSPKIDTIIHQKFSTVCQSDFNEWVNGYILTLHN